VKEIAPLNRKADVSCHIFTEAGINEYKICSDRFRSPGGAVSRPILVTAALTTFAFSALARTEKLESGESPNGRYRVQVEQGSHGDITYDLVRTRDDMVLHRFWSSYQPDEGELPDWSWNHSCDASVGWSPDIHYLAIGQAAHRYAGAVLLGEVTRRGIREISLPEQSMLRATKREWDRYMFHLDDGWISDDRVSLGFAGRRNEDKYVSRFKIILRIKAGRAVLSSCRNLSQGW
jgi:hypothetical protein